MELAEGRVLGRCWVYEPDNFSVDGARNAVLQLQVHLGDGVLLEDGGIGDITCEC